MSETYRHFFVKALYDMRESVILGMDQRRKPQEKDKIDQAVGNLNDFGDRLSGLKGKLTDTDKENKHLGLKQ